MWLKMQIARSHFLRRKVSAYFPEKEDQLVTSANLIKSCSRGVLRQHVSVLRENLNLSITGGSEFLSPAATLRRCGPTSFIYGPFGFLFPIVSLPLTKSFHVCTRD